MSKHTAKKIKIENMEDFGIEWGAEYRGFVCEFHNYGRAARRGSIAKYRVFIRNFESTGEHRNVGHVNTLDEGLVKFAHFIDRHIDPSIAAAEHEASKAGKIEKLEARRARLASAEYLQEKITALMAEHAAELAEVEQKIEEVTNTPAAQLANPFGRYGG